MRAFGARINRGTAERLLAGDVSVKSRHRKLAVLLAAAAAPDTPTARDNRAVTAWVAAGGRIAGAPTVGAATGSTIDTAAAGNFGAGAATVSGAAGASAAGGGGAPAAPVTASRTRRATAWQLSHPVPGEAVVLAAFRAAAPDQRRRTSVITKLLTLKIAVGAATVLTAGGVAFAASNGTLPNPLSDQGKTHSSVGDATTAPNGKGSPSPSLVGLCKAYEAKVGDNPHGKALDSPAFKALIAAAGGEDKVSSYCTDLLADAKSKGDTGDDHATDAPTTHPTGPGTHPTGAPDDRPTGGPSHPH